MASRSRRRPLGAILCGVTNTNGDAFDGAQSLGHATVLAGLHGGRYPHGNSLLIRGTAETALIDPSLTIARTPHPPSGVDRILISHAHEDHLAGLVRYPTVPIHAPVADLAGLHSLDGLMALYGLPPGIDERWRRALVDEFHYEPRPQALGYGDGDKFDLGGATLHAIHLPGHTSGHSGLFLEPDDLLFLADIDLTTFGPYYGDASSSLDDFEQTLTRCRDIEARWYVTFHHKGVVEGRAAFLRLLEEYHAAIGRRERALLAYLTTPRSMDEIVRHRFVYRPHVDLIFVEGAERRSAELHLERLVARGLATELEPGRYLRTALA